MNIKKIKDPIYGYIEIDENIAHNIIDTATFQRLRNIRQTSYAPLYPASVHNRFIHSIGVYHLGKIAIDALLKSVKNHSEQHTRILGDLAELTGNTMEHFKSIFELACLLHDVGHSPFSHTGEEFYKTSRSKTLIEERDGEGNNIPYSFRKHLSQLTKDPVFCTPEGENPGPHEIMSCIVAIESFGKDDHFFKSFEDKAFFARCITGIKYKEVCGLEQKHYLEMDVKQHNEVKVKQLQNCLIQILHSSVIDVDRLDYIIRDAATMGYQSVGVDYERLLNGIVLVMEDEYNFTVGFHKNALSVIENAVYAHDNEKKWIQGHPTIIYDSFLLQKSIIAIEDRLKQQYPDARSTLFSYDSLTSEGSQFGDTKVRYLGDADLIHLMKNVYPCDYSEEYFNRNLRRIPVWKSEAEFRNLYSADDREKISSAIGIIMSGSSDSCAEVNNRAVAAIEAEIVDAKKQNFENKVKVQERKKKCFEALLGVCNKHGIKEDVVLISSSFFKSNFSKGEIQKLIIMFPDGRAPCRLQDVSTTLSSSSPNGGSLIYLFYYPKEGRGKVNLHEFSADLLNAFKQALSICGA